MEDAGKAKAKRMILGAFAAIVLLTTTLLTGCQASICSSCGKQFNGAGCYDVLRGKDNPYTMCEKCADAYYSPLDYKTFKR